MDHQKRKLENPVVKAKRQANDREEKSFSLFFLFVHTYPMIKCRTFSFILLRTLLSFSLKLYLSSFVQYVYELIDFSNSI